MNAVTVNVFKTLQFLYLAKRELFILFIVIQYLKYVSFCLYSPLVTNGSLQSVIVSLPGASHSLFILRY